jgi:hypothetical protein
MEYLLSCQCGLQHRVSRSQAGQELACGCGLRLQVPTLRGLSQLPLAGSNETEATHEKSVWAGWRGITLAIASAIFLIFVLPCAYYLYERSLIDTSYTVTEELAAGVAEIDALDLNMMVVRWLDFEKNGLGPKSKPPFYYYKKAAQEREILSMVTGGVAAVAGLVAALVWITTPKSK